MPLAKSVVVPGMLAQYSSFAELLRGLTDAQWEQASRCEGWRVADVAAHVVGQLSDVTALRLDDLGTPEVTQRQVEERRGRGPGALAEELEAATKSATDLVAAFDDTAYEAEGPQGGGRSLGFGLESLWFDTYLHADDILSTFGEKVTEKSGLAPSVSHITQILTGEGWGPATISLKGLDEFYVGGGNGSRIVSGDPLQFILVATGRADPATMDLDPEVNIYR